MSLPLRHRSAMFGHTLGVSEKTVEHYLSHAFEKLAVSRRAQAALPFVRQFELPSIDTALVTA